MKREKIQIAQLDEGLWFPEPGSVEPDIIAVGGDLSPERLILAYSIGIFPWYNTPGEIHWWCPEERCVLYPKEFHLSRSLRKTILQGKFSVTMDRAFVDVIEGCRGGKRVGNTWILEEVVAAYSDLHRRGIAHSVEIWNNGKLAGGLYGVALGKVFFGESMFSRQADSSKVALYYLSQLLLEKGWSMIDCQVMNDHTFSMGGKAVSRYKFLRDLKVEMKYPTEAGSWDNGLEPAVVMLSEKHLLNESDN